MGYQPSSKVYSLEFVDFPGLEVIASGTSLGKLLSLSDLKLDLNNMEEGKRLEVFNFFASRLVSWNMEHPEIDDLGELEEVPSGDGSMMVCRHCKVQPGAEMPCTVTSLLCLELSFIMRIIIGWMSAIANVSIPKELSLSDGGRSIEEQVMKLAQHQNLSTLPMPNLS